MSNHGEAFHSNVTIRTKTKYLLSEVGIERTKCLHLKSFVAFKPFCFCTTLNYLFESALLIPVTYKSCPLLPKMVQFANLIIVHVHEQIQMCMSMSSI
jgi:hypothetical protein